MQCSTDTLMDTVKFINHFPVNFLSFKKIIFEDYYSHPLIYLRAAAGLGSRLDVYTF